MCVGCVGRVNINGRRENISLRAPEREIKNGYKCGTNGEGVDGGWNQGKGATGPQASIDVSRSVGGMEVQVFGSGKYSDVRIDKNYGMERVHGLTTALLSNRQGRQRRRVEGWVDGERRSTR